ncbi:STAS domain-containing protein [Anaeromyxobacter oryzisoli]|uniref:STAS domain-containing protein n=1 Tax=Anaeromyxobacter oryzisoli TaxID=2925408 RepID=UPI001F5AAE5D|nr:STAS domain-containing protein [Anaeromyxobacter sp. SG63]
MAGGCTFEREREGERTVLRLAGTFDRAAALELARRVEAERGRELILDFSLVREFADLGVATLAQGLAHTERRLVLRGLRQHQLRMFRYFGVDVEPSRGAVDPGAA